MIKQEKTKSEISNLIDNDNNFKKIIEVFKNNEFSDGNRYEYVDESKSGLSNIFYTITLNENLNKIIMPVFSSEKTTTWNFSYLKKIREYLSNEYTDLEDHEIVSKIIIPIYYYDKYTGDVQFLSVIKLNDFLEYGMKGKNGYSVYFWNDKLPNRYNIKLKDLRSDLFIDSLPLYNKKQLRVLCTDYATKYFTKFSTLSNSRSDKQKIKNISDGLYAQIYTYLQLIKNGYNVSMDWHMEDDLGIDIKFYINGETINIDVKSTRTTDLKISKNRKETDFYAICIWDKKSKEPILTGFIHKYRFWKSSLFKTEAPILDNEMYHKSLEQLQSYVYTIDDLFKEWHNYNSLKMKRGEKLFAIQ